MRHEVEAEMDRYSSITSHVLIISTHLHVYLCFGGVAGLDGIGVGATSVLRAGRSWNRSR